MGLRSFCSWRFQCIILICPVHQGKPLLLVGARANHELRLDEGIKVLFVEGLELHGALLEGETLLVSVLGDLGGHVVSDLGVEAGNEHETGLC